MLTLNTRKYINCTSKASCLDTITRITNLANLTRQWGILELDNIITATDHFLLKLGVMLVVDGAKPQQVQEILNNTIVASFATGEELLNQLIITRGVLAIQAGYNPRLIEFNLHAFLGELHYGEVL
ncbi:MAG: hypothetical protein FWG68_12165 [Defluviitaleaceae bacterium]|nr:hypothetical protein [Defluviitaleaceae bacterium]